MIIKGFWYVMLQNHWFSIVEDQLRILINSGLYDKVEEINIGCVGSEQEKGYLQEFIVNKYPKLKLKYHSTNIQEYEYPTLKLIENDNTEYCGFYFHTKGCSYPSDTLVNRWRTWLNEENLNLWEDHYKNIIEGYDISGVNYLVGYNHYSGNFFWFNRNYITKLPKLDSFDLNNRWGAEQWICSVENKKYNKGSDNNYIIKRNV